MVDPTIDALRSAQRARGEFTSGDWGCAVVTTTANEPPNLAFAQFTVPTVLEIDQATPYRCWSARPAQPRVRHAGEQPDTSAAS